MQRVPRLPAQQAHVIAIQDEHPPPGQWLDGIVTVPLPTLELADAWLGGRGVCQGADRSVLLGPQRSCPGAARCLNSSTFQSPKTSAAPLTQTLVEHRAAVAVQAVIAQHVVDRRLQPSKDVQDVLQRRVWSGPHRARLRGGH